MENYILHREPVTLEAGVVKEVRLPRQVSIYNSFCRIEVDFNNTLQIDLVALHSEQSGKTIGFTWKIIRPISNFDFSPKEVLSNDPLTEFDYVELKSTTNILMAISVIENL